MLIACFRMSKISSQFATPFCAAILFDVRKAVYLKAMKTAIILPLQRILSPEHCYMATVEVTLESQALLQMLISACAISTNES